jgi:hypothetical protein
LKRAEYSPEQIAEILSADAPCNQYIAKQKDKRTAIEKMINRAQAPTATAAAPSGPVEPTTAVLTPDQRPPLLGGFYDAAAALAMLNAHYLIGTSEKDTSIYKITDDNRLQFVPDFQFELEVANVIVPSSDGKHIPGSKFWRGHAQRHQCKLVFKPHNNLLPGEYNLWRGFGVVPWAGTAKIERLLEHIKKVICKGDERVVHLRRPTLPTGSPKSGNSANARVL